MASASFCRILNRTLKANASMSTRASLKEVAVSANNLHSRIMALGDPNARVTPVLYQWLKEGGHVENFVLSDFIKNLRARKRYRQALELLKFVEEDDKASLQFSVLLEQSKVFEWVTNNRAEKLCPAEHAIQLELIGRVRGLKAAESYFESLGSEDKVDKTYGALLYCYVMAGEVEKSLSHMQTMKELGFALTSLNYNGIMSIYTRNGQLEKVPDVLSEMKENGVMPDIVSYRICMNAYGERGDIDSVEKILKEAESQPHIAIDWLTYATLGNICIEAGQKQKALVYLRCCEAMDIKGRSYGPLISHYARLGNKAEMMRLWGVRKTKFKKPQRLEYINIISCSIKLGEFEESEKLLKEWEASCDFYDFRVPNTLLFGYCRRGLVEKAEAILQGIIERRKTVVPTCWFIIAEGYENMQNMGKAFECMKSALALQSENKWWRPEPAKFSGVLSWLGDNGNVEDVEEFVRLLEVNVPKNREMYHALIKAYIRGGKSVNELVDRMKDDKIDEDEETERILSSIR